MKTVLFIENGAAPARHRMMDSYGSYRSLLDECALAFDIEVRTWNPDGTTLETMLPEFKPDFDEEGWRAIVVADLSFGRGKNRGNAAVANPFDLYDPPADGQGGAFGLDAACIADPEPIVEQLARLNEQLAVRNRRAARIWKIVGITLAAIVVIWLVLAALFAVDYNSASPAGSVTWTCTLDGETYTCGVSYTKQYQILSVYYEEDSALFDRVLEAGVDPGTCEDAKQARTVLYDWFEGQGGTVEVLRQEGLPLDG